MILSSRQAKILFVWLTIKIRRSFYIEDISILKQTLDELSIDRSG